MFLGLRNADEGNRFIDGDPQNNEANGTLFEHEWLTNQLRFGGDLKGLGSHLDYLQGMGIKALYLAGSPFSEWSKHLVLLL